MNISSIITLIGTILGSQAFVAFVQARIMKRKTDADAAAILLDKTLEWASRLSVRIEKLEAMVAELEHKNSELLAHIAKLESQNKQGE